MPRSSQYVVLAVTAWQRPFENNTRSNANYVVWTELWTSSVTIVISRTPFHGFGYTIPVYTWFILHPVSHSDRFPNFHTLINNTHACISSDVEVRRKNSIIVTYLPSQCTYTNVTRSNFNSFVFLHFYFSSRILLILSVYNPVLI
jgi:hypothetical protein